MSSMSDPPSSCITNSYILHDFAEIAYIVCTHAIPASNDHESDINSSENILKRLKNAEKQFREASILVALDADKLELFTFYKKVDVVKHQRTILNKFGLVCRLNSCIIARKSAARVLELLKAESSRVYQLFTSAILSSIRLWSPFASGETVTIGSRKYLISSSTTRDNTEGVFLSNPWYLYRINLQVTTTGQVVLLILAAKDRPLYRFYDTMTKIDLNSITDSAQLLLYLAPTGQMARYTRGNSGNFPTDAKSARVTNLRSRYHAWMEATIEWLNGLVGAEIVPEDEKEWVEVDIPIIERIVSPNESPGPMLTWRSVAWPTKLIYMFLPSTGVGSAHEQSAVEADPLQAIQEWYMNSIERNNAIARFQLNDDKAHTTEDGSLFSEDAHFDDTDATNVFGVPVFSTGQTIYPTPPDATVAHATPGMSIDGVVATPVPLTHAFHTSPDTVQDQEMQDVTTNMPSANAHSPLYADDLFEELPDEAFGPDDVGDEPNWDFFDQPGFNRRESGAERQERVRRDVGQSVTKDRPTTLTEKPQDTLPDSPSAKSEVTPGLSSPRGASVSHSLLGAELGDVTHNTQRTKLGSLGPHSNNQQTSERGVDHQSSSAVSTHGRNVLRYNDATFVTNQSNRRRSSVFDGASTTLTPLEYDLKYQVKGKYWFHHLGQGSIVNSSQVMVKPPTRSSSSSSDTSMASVTTTVSDSDNNHACSDHHRLAQRMWTEYDEQPSKAQSPRNHEEFKCALPSEQITELLDVIASAAGDEPFLYDIQTPIANSKNLNYDDQKMSMVAQILVEQTTQSCLLRDDKVLRLHRGANTPAVNMTMDHSENKSIIANASLADLTAMSPNSTTTAHPSKVRVVESARIILRRADGEVKANLPVLSFWDLLGLQPFHGQKDITTFCLHPASSNVFDGCTTFLNRIAEAYSACNLGTHNIGRIAGLTNDGLIAWTAASGTGRDLRAVSQKLGAGIASLGNGGTVLIYMVNPVTSMSSCRNICRAFTMIFDTFIKATQQSPGSTELVLQIIPISFLAAPDILVIPDHEAYLELALEVYNRVPLKDASQRPAVSSAAVMLEPEPVRDFTFELVKTPGNPIAGEGQYLHLAYACSIDSRWLTATWTDNEGAIAFTTSYCLQARPGGGSRSRRDVLRDIWEVSHDMMNTNRQKWRLVVAKSGFYDDDELRDWLSLINQNQGERKAIARLILLSVQLEPTIQLQSLSSMVRAPTTAAASTLPAPNMAGTPGSTPQMSTTSPDHGVVATPTSGGPAHTNAPTPPEHNFDSTIDGETVLVDTEEESWTAILAFGVNQSHDFRVIRPAAASGLLIKRTGGGEDKSGMTAIEVHLVVTSRSAPSAPTQTERDGLLEGILGQYRRLVTLAASRGCINKHTECVPWHIATAVKGARVLGEAM